MRNGERERESARIGVWRKAKEMISVLGERDERDGVHCSALRAVYCVAAWLEVIWQGCARRRGVCGERRM